MISFFARMMAFNRLHTLYSQQGWNIFRHYITHQVIACVSEYGYPCRLDR
jgi:hypothetical protein